MAVADVCWCRPLVQCEARLSRGGVWGRLGDRGRTPARRTWRGGLVAAARARLTLRRRPAVGRSGIPGHPPSLAATNRTGPADKVRAKSLRHPSLAATNRTGPADKVRAKSLLHPLR